MIAHALQRLSDLAWPPVCPVSGAAVEENGRLAPAAWHGLTFLDAPWCSTCGLPFPYPGAGGSQAATLCAMCIARPPVFDKARAPLAYDDASRPLVLGFKHGGRREMIDRFARWMTVAGGDCLADADVILPVPLHWRRLWSRRYNQSALLGRALSARTGLPMETDRLLRKRATPSQAGQSAKSRKRNVAGAFVVPDRNSVQGRRFVLIDDVFTTGATATACARALKRAGAVRVYVMTLCRVVRTSDPTI
ncbi:ComF family protein [Maricaulis sp.]|uniref:ComF family protein n=1 Tax=Maricaulis sp. TaxID=1486257 RepID=UPI00260482EA|nr:ComF family protein [Maricaulis sp.]